MRFGARSPILIALALAAALLMPQAAQAAYIPAGYDYFCTDNGSVVMPGIGTVQLQGFAWPGASDPTLLFPLPALPPVGEVLFQVTWLDQHGNVVGPDSVHKVTQVITPNPSAGPFDTIVRRKVDASITGVGGETTIPIEIVWLSLKSSAPIDIGLPFLVDAYVGLHPGGQIEGKAKLVSGLDCGNAGTVDLGLKGVSTDNPADPSFLGLPVTYDVKFIPHDMDPIASNVVYRQDGVQAIFHGDSQSPSGQYTVNKPVPEPSALVLALSGYGLVFRRRLFRRRDG